MSRTGSSADSGFEVLAQAVAGASKRLADLEATTLYRHNGSAVVVGPPPTATYAQLTAGWATYPDLEADFTSYDQMTGYRP